MKIYVAGKAGDNTSTDARVIMDKLTEAGHEITLDWTVFDSRQRLGPRRTEGVAKAMVHGVRLADALVLARPSLKVGAVEREGLGCYVELGIALGLGKPIFVLPGRTSIFWSLEQVTPVEDLAVLKQKLFELGTAK